MQKKLDSLSTALKLTAKPNFDLDDDNRDVKLIFRLGKDRLPNNKPRPLKVCFNSAHDASEIISHLGNLKGNSNYKGISVSKDLTKQEQIERKKLLDEVKVKRNHGVSCRLVGNRIVVTNK